jgi:hypothetical protein
MRLTGIKFFFLSIVMFLLVTACAANNGNSQGTPTAISGQVTETMDSALQSGNPPGDGTTPAYTPSATPTGLIGTPPVTVPTPGPGTQQASEIDWRDIPIMPAISQHVIQIYQEGQAQGRDPQHFSVIGDCQSIPFVFMGPFGRGILEPSRADDYLWDAISQFKDSLLRWSVTSRGGFTAASILNPIQADQEYCKPGETPLTCEYRLNNPAYAFITLETWLDPNSIDRYETYLRQIVEYVLAHGTIPILLTKADSAEVLNGKYVINPAMVRVARDYDIPIVNFWRSAQYLPNAGIDPAREGFHLSQQGYDLKNTLALRALYAIWQANTGGSTGGLSGTANPGITPTQQATLASENSPTVTLPDCEGGCIYFGTATSIDGEVATQGVYAYGYANQKLTQVLGDGFDLQDISEDGHRLLVNQANRLYEVDLVGDSVNLISGSFFSNGRQDAYWNSDDSAVIFLDQDNPLQTDTGQAYSLFPSNRDGEIYFETGACPSKDYCQSSGMYRLNPDHSTARLDSFSRPVFSPNGKLVAFLNPAAATKDNYFHIGYLLHEEPDLGIASRGVLYFPEEGGFMVYPDVREYAYSPDNNRLFILYDVYSAYFEKSLRIQTYLLDTKNGILYDYGKLSGTSGSLNPRFVWDPQGNQVLLLLTDVNADNQYSLRIYQTRLDTGERMIPFSTALMTSNDYFYITNLYWR